MRKSCLILTLAALSLFTACSRPSAVDEDAPARNQGSNTTIDVARALDEAYREIDAGVAVIGGSSGTGIEVLIEGTGDFAFAMRRLNDREKEAAGGKGFEPVEHLVGRDVLAIYLHHDNPIVALSVAQLAEIYGEGGMTETWDQLMEFEVPGCGSDEIMRFSSRSDSDAYAYFQQAVLGERDAKSGALEIDDPREIVEQVEKIPCAIGYSSLANLIERVKLACIITPEGREEIDDGTATGEPIKCAYPSVTAAIDGSYPLVKPLLMITRGKPQGAVKAYLDWVLSDAGQCILQDRGYAPVKAVACR